MTEAKIGAGNNEGYSIKVTPRPQQDGVIVAETAPKSPEQQLAEVKQQLAEANEKITSLTAELDIAKSESILDQLTGFENRRGLERAKPTLEVDRYPVLCIAADLDGLKLINDQYGHDAGDKYILSFVKFVKEALRPDDDAYRVGGDEFLITAKNINTDPNFSPEILRLRILEKLEEFNETNYYSKKSEERTIDHPLEFTFGVKSTNPDLVGQSLDQSQRLEEINCTIKAADDEEIERKEIKKAKQAEQNSQQ
jgi:diguanylate cyclase (GGDEF)-like protein